MKRPRVVPLMDFIPALTPRYHAPVHLAPMVEALERTERESVHVTISVPPRHDKTETLSHFGARALRVDPSRRIMYVSYAQRLSEKKSRGMRELTKRAGAPLANDSRSKSDWRTGADDGGVWATSPGGSITGEGADLILCDDLVRGRADAESSLERERLWEWFQSDLLTRLEPGGSVVVCGTRWHPDDIIGRLNASGYEHVKLPAIGDDGAALYPERWPLDVLEMKRAQVGEYAWWSLYMQEPRPRGGELFKDVRFYDSLPPGVRYGLGCDFAYSTATRADYSCAVVLAECDDVFYVVDVVRGQMPVTEFRVHLAGLAATYRTEVTTYVSGTEKGVVDVLSDMGLPIDPLPATGDKFTRSQPVAAAWNAGRVLLPRNAPWLDAFVSELLAFTGVRDRHDDQIDALAGAFASVGDAWVSDDDHGGAMRVGDAGEEVRVVEGRDLADFSGIVGATTHYSTGGDW